VSKFLVSIDPIPNMKYNYISYHFIALGCITFHLTRYPKDLVRYEIELNISPPSLLKGSSD